jgi:hypothetical protein
MKHKEVECKKETKTDCGRYINFVGLHSYELFDIHHSIHILHQERLSLDGDRRIYDGRLGTSQITRHSLKCKS